MIFERATGLVRPLLHGLSGGHVHEKSLSEPWDSADGAVNECHCDAVQRRGWRDVLLLLDPTLISCRKIVMHLFCDEKRASTMTGSTW